MLKKQQLTAADKAVQGDKKVVELSMGAFYYTFGWNTATVYVCGTLNEVNETDQRGSNSSSVKRMITTT